jgi:hypothetical protein
MDQIISQQYPETCACNKWGTVESGVFYAVRADATLRLNSQLTAKFAG